MLETPAGARLVEGPVALAPPGLARLVRYPRAALQLPLPDASQARLPAPDGTVYGFRGSAVLRARPERWREVHGAAGGAGLQGVLQAALAEAAGPGAPPTGPELRPALQEALAARGVDLLDLRVDAVDVLAARPGEAAEDTGARVLLVGLDGADWAIIDPLLAQGRMPHLARLLERGTRAKLLSISPMLSPVIWTSMATGVEPGRHGVLDFLVADPAGGPGQPVTSAQRTAPAFWEILSRARIPVGIVGWWATWPADPVHGYVVSDRIAYQLFGFRADLDRAEGKTWPPDLYASEVRPRIVAPSSVGWDQVQPYLSGSRRTPEAFDPEEREMIDGLRTALASGRTYVDLATALRARFSPRLEAVYLEATDTVAHLFMPYRPPPLSGVPAARRESFGEVVDRAYEQADAWLGRLLEGRGDAWTVIVASDHGFATDQTRPRTTDSRIGHGPAADWHRRFGVLVVAGARARTGGRLPEASIYDVAPTVLALFGQPVPRSWKGRVLVEALDPAFLREHPVRFTDEEVPREGAGEAAPLPEDPGAAELRAKLKTLGYVSGGPGEGMTTRNNRGVTLLGEGRYEEAARAFREALASTPDQPTLQANLGLALHLAGKPSEARSWLEKARRAPSVHRAATHILAQMELQEGRPEAAAALLREVLEREPGAADVRNTLGLVRERLGDAAGAEAEWRRAAETDPHAAEPRNNLGNAARTRGDLAAAAGWYERAIEADPFFMGAYNNLAMVYQDRGETGRAVELYRRALEKAPRSAIVLNNLGSLHWGRGEREEARDLWTRAAAADPRYPSPLNNLAGVALEEGKLEEAGELLGRALALEPGYGDARINLALLEARRGRLDRAREELDRAARDPRAAATAAEVRRRLEQAAAGRAGGS